MKSRVDETLVGQVFDCLIFPDQNHSMEISEVRRLRLKEWFSGRSIPEKEKSYLSQLMGGKASFGEKAARRLEGEYGMPTRHLDQSYEADIPVGLLPKNWPFTVPLAQLEAHGLIDEIDLFIQFQMSKVIKARQTAKKRGD